MNILYYCEYSNGRRYVRAYDEEKHGTPRIAGKSAFLYHGSVILSKENIFTNEKAALASWGKYSNKPVIMPDGREVIPAQHFGNNAAADVFIPWTCVQGEKWPGEY